MQTDVDDDDYLHVSPEEEAEADRLAQEAEAAWRKEQEARDARLAKAAHLSRQAKMLQK
jgi:hypothetical protein